MPQPASPSSIGRRRFLTSLAALAGGGFATLVGVAPPAGAEDTVTLWRLNANWGYPVGPNGKTRCTCRACHLHAANKIFRTSDAAVAARIHPCCLCQPESFVVPAGCVTALFASSGGDATDRRYEGVAATLSGCFATIPPPAGSVPSTPAASSPPSTAVPSLRAPVPAGATSGTVPVASGSPTATRSGAAEAGSPSPEANGDTLPVTGIDLGPVIAAAGVLTVAGAVATVVAHESRVGERDGGSADQR
jgi:hypothetical protein